MPAGKEPTMPSFEDAVACYDKEKNLAAKWLEGCLWAMFQWNTTASGRVAGLQSVTGFLDGQLAVLLTRKPEGWIWFVFDRESERLRACGKPDLDLRQAVYDSVLAAWDFARGYHGPGDVSLSISRAIAKGRGLRHLEFPGSMPNTRKKRKSIKHR